MIKYYLLDNRIATDGCSQTKDENGVVIGYCVKQPVFMKQYPYYKLSFKPDGSQCIVQAYQEVKEAKELTLEEAQKQTDQWFEENKKLGNETEDAKPAVIKSYDHDDMIKHIVSVREDKDLSWIDKPIAGLNRSVN